MREKETTLRAEINEERKTQETASLEKEGREA
jgi:hypothetical protein